MRRYCRWAHITARAPFSTAFDIAMVIPRSLNDPVGLALKFQIQVDAGRFSASLAARISGYCLPSVITGVLSLTRALILFYDAAQHS
jgi:hypothetical protein